MINLSASSYVDYSFKRLPNYRLLLKKTKHFAYSKNEIFKIELSDLISIMIMSAHSG